MPFDLCEAVQLSAKTVLTPVADLPPVLLDQIEADEDAVAISRKGGRQSSKLIDADTAWMLERFREPCKITDAVLRYVEAHGGPAEEVLEGFLPVAAELLREGYLIGQGSHPQDAATHDGARPAPDDAPDNLTDFPNLTPIRRIQALEDTDVFLVRQGDGSFAALKRGHAEVDPSIRARLRQEVAVLGRLARTPAPRVIEADPEAERPFVLQSWLDGANVAVAAGLMRQAGGQDELLALLIAVAEAYAILHEEGVLHGDIHPGNILVDAEGAVQLLDFGLGYRIDTDEAAAMQRPGVSFHSEPELAKAYAGMAKPLAPSPSGEQYALASVLYLLATGNHYADFSLERAVLLRQIADDRPRSFAELGIAPWPALEKVLVRALQKAPSKRFTDIGALARALRRVPSATQAATVTSDDHAAAVERTVSALRPDQDGLFAKGLPHGPLASCNFGAAGIAYTLFRLACGRDDPELLAWSRTWIAKAMRDAALADAFTHPSGDLDPETVGPVSIYHTRSGISLVDALIADAEGEVGGFIAAARRYIELGSAPCTERDLTLGRAGLVIGSCLLLDSHAAVAKPIEHELSQFGQTIMDGILEEVQPLPPLERCAELPNIGMAHGWAGLLYTALRWQAMGGTQAPAWIGERLQQLLACTTPSGRGLSIPWRSALAPTANAMPGWCNGSAGLVYLFTLAAEVLEQPDWLAAAEAFAWHSYEAGGGTADLCCGLAGRAYALAAFANAADQPHWLDRSRALAAQAVKVAPGVASADHPPHSLYKGELGAMLLLDELERPDRISMPLFDRQR